MCYSPGRRWESACSAPGFAAARTGGWSRAAAAPRRPRPGVVHVLLPADVATLGRLPLLVPHSSLVAPVCPEILPQEVVSYSGIFPVRIMNQW